MGKKERHALNMLLIQVKIHQKFPMKFGQQFITHNYNMISEWALQFWCYALYNPPIAKENF